MNFLVVSCSLRADVLLIFAPEQQRRSQTARIPSGSTQAGQLIKLGGTGRHREALGMEAAAHRGLKLPCARPVKNPCITLHISLARKLEDGAANRCEDGRGKLLWYRETNPGDAPARPDQHISIRSSTETRPLLFLGPHGRAGRPAWADSGARTRKCA